MAESKSDEIHKIATAWCHQPSPLPANQRLTQIAGLLYMFRNDQLTPAQIALFPPNGHSDDEETMAAVEHYFFARSQVANAEYSSANMKAYTIGYQLVKKLGVDLRHNKNKPTTPPSKLQQDWALMGAAQGQQDLQRDNEIRERAGLEKLKPPMFRLPPNFTGTYGGMRLDRVRY